MGYLPEILSDTVLTSTPKWPVKPSSSTTIKRGYTEAWYRQCQASGVGEYAPGKCFSVVGSFPSSSIFRECEREAESGKMPVVPMPLSAIYVPFVYNRENGSTGGLENIEKREMSAVASPLIESSISAKKYGGRPLPTRIKFQESCKGLAIRQKDFIASDEAHEGLYIDTSAVLARADEFRNNVIAALTSGRKSSSDSCDSRPSHDELPFVCKWVDYSRKHGIGYVLAEGSVGIIANHTSVMPVMHTVVENGSEYFKTTNDGVAVQAVPYNFFMQADDGSLEEVTLTGMVRRQHTTLWAKFARYMCKQLNTPMAGASSKEGKRPITIVRFYQRVGNISFNFPDHTKIVLSADGIHASFTVLPLSAVEHINSDSTHLSVDFIKARKAVSGTLAQLLYGTQPSADLTSKSSTSSNETNVIALTAANALPDKLRFVVELVGHWISGGGLGCKPAGTEWAVWEGTTLEYAGESKSDWVTVGRFGGDEQAQGEKRD
ncbi:hypothetical protein SNOG_01809 [Parastagonospora nodorum SN15]|uniref:Uncharacterized protein n=1 Tax=Phaeosphaeria nodorum (strain SN15 / ATCC MYA-4574 / FGSC 10173) TaxID=321614 RepID=Q0V2F5_PHANO|nr:hypothetical protein SNOG_01809 [Parastagonospora nodorum SN15]EAT91458.2 hypothetical protein SNOG_01809 [Parastagonospora nodorum SN15]